MCSIYTLCGLWESFKKYIPSTLWFLQMGHQTKVHPMQCGRLLVTDTLNKIHTLAKQLLVKADGESKFYNILREAPGFCCSLWIRLKGENLNRNVPKEQDLFYLSRTVAVLCTNDLAFTPRQDVEGSIDIKIRSVPVLVDLKRWIYNKVYEAYNTKRSKLHRRIQIIYELCW